MSWVEWVRYYESPTIYGSRYLFAKFALDNFGISAQGDEPIPMERGINSRERWYKAIIRWALANNKTASLGALAFIK